MKSSRKNLLATTVIAGIAVMAPSFAVAQAQTTQAQRQQQQQREEEAAQVDEVVVTGSRIRRNEFTSSQPIQVITSEQSTLEGLVDTTEILQGLSLIHI